MYILNTYPNNQPFRKYKVIENRKWTELPQTDLEQLTVKSILYTPEAQIFIRFALQLDFFETQGCAKLEMHRMTSE